MRGYKRNVSITIAMLLSFSIALAGTNAFALTFTNQTNVSNIGDLINNVIDFLFTISIPLLTAIVLYGGFTMITSQGDAAKFRSGWMIILYAVIGFAVLLLAKGIGLVIKDAMGSAN